MSFQQILRTMHAITSYLVILSLLISPAHTSRSVNAAPDPDAVQLPADASLSFTKSDSLLADTNSDGLIGAGDTLRYTLTAQNTGSVDASGVWLEDILGEHLTLVAGSVRTTPLAFDQTLEVLEDSSPTAFILEGADFDGDLVTFDIRTPPVHGAVGGTAPNLTYQPVLGNYNGADSLAFEVCDAATPPNCDSAAVQITIVPVNDPPTFTPGNSIITVLEDSDPYIQANWATVISPGPANESSQAVSFLVTNDNQSLFSEQPSIDSSGTLTFTPAANQYGQATVRVVLQDNGGTASGGSDTSPAYTITVNVLAVNDAPSFSAGADVSVLEDAGLQTIEGWARNISPGPNEDGQTVSFEVLSYSNPGLFTVAPAVNPTGTLTFRSADDMAGSAEISLRLKDDGGSDHSGVDASAAQTFTISVQEHNDAPLVNPAAFSLDENSSLGTVVGNVTFTDPDPSQAHSFSITAGNTGGAFAISPATDPVSGAVSGLIEVANPAALNYETTPTFTLTVTVTDNAFPPENGSAVVTVQVNDINEAPVVDAKIFSLPENSPAGTVVGMVTARDDDHDPFTFAITAGNTGGTFAISESGVVTVANPLALDYESATNIFSLTITATDNRSPAATGSATITVNLSDVNEPPQIEDDSFTVDEFSQNDTIVGVLKVTNPEAGQQLTYSILAGNIGNAFTIDPAGNLVVANSSALDFNTNPSFALTVQVSDDADPPLSDTAQIRVQVNNINDAPVVAGGSFTLDENVAIGTLLTTVSFTDRDAGQAHTFAIVSGNTGSTFAINPSTGAITTAAAVDYETLAAYTLRVEVTDNGTPPATGAASIQVAVNNLNEPPLAENTAFSLPENSPAGTSIGTLVATDPDTGQELTFTITSGNTGGAFAIDDDGEITVANQSALNYEVRTTINLEVEIQDNGVPAESIRIAVTVNLLDVNEAPNLADAVLSIEENLPDSTLVTTLSHNDPDTGQTHTFAITAGNTGDAFAIGSDGKITVIKSSMLNYEDATTRSFVLTVVVRDSATPPLSDTALVTINLTDVNEAPVVTGESYETAGNTTLQVAQSATEPAPRIFLQGSLLANDSDPDFGDTIQCTLTGKHSDAEVSVTPTGEFTYLPPPGVTSDSFTYTVTDSQGLSATGTVAIEMVGKVWYVNNDSTAGGRGRSSDPFDTLVEAQTASTAGDTIYVYYGDGTSGGQNIGITLKNNQRLIGAGVALELPVTLNQVPGPIRLLESDRQPVIENLNGKGVSISEITAEVRGLNIKGSETGVDAAYSTTRNLTVASNTITSNGIGFKMRVTAGTADLNFSSNTLTTIGNAVDILRSGGALVISGFADNEVKGDTTGSGVMINSAVFDAVPGGSLDPVNLGALTIGTSDNKVGGNGLSITGTRGSLQFNELKIYAQNGYGMQSSGVAGYTDGGLLISIPSGKGLIHATGGAAVSLENLAVNAPDLMINSATSSGYGIRLVNVNGTLSSTNNSAINGSNTAAFYVSGGSAALTYHGTITHSAGRTVEVSDRTGGSLTFSGAIVGGGTGVLLNANNSSTTTAFTGGLTLNTGSNAAFTATNAGKLTVTGTTNTLTTSTGTALRVVHTTINAAGLIFKSVNVNGAPTGIELDDTGTQGGLTVNGTGSAGTGGTIQNTTGDGVRLKNTRNVTLKGLNITNAVTGVTDPSCGLENALPCRGSVTMDTAANVVLDQINATTSGQMGISAYQVNGLTITNTTVSGAGNSNDEFALLLHNPIGTLKIEDTTFTNMYETGVRLYKTDSALLNLTMLRVTVDRNNAAAGEDGFQFKIAGSGQANILVDTSTFTNLQRDGIDGVYQDGARLNLTVQKSTFQNNAGFGGIIISGSTNIAGPYAEGYLTIDQNTITNTISTPIVLTSAVNAKLDAKITNNTITGPANPANHIGEGIRLSQEENSTMTALVSGNTITGVSMRDISGYARLATTGGSLHATVVSNQANQPASDPAYAIDFNTQGANNSICLDLRGNTATGNNAAGIRLRNSAGTFQLESWLPPLGLAEATSYINGQNISSPPAELSVATGREFTSATTGSCRDAAGATLPPSAMTTSPQMAQVPVRPPGLAKLILQDPLPGDTVQVNIGTLPAGKTVTVTFDTQIADPLPEDVFQISNQAVLRGSNFRAVLSDDPATLAVLGDATVTQLYKTAIAMDDLFMFDEDQTFSIAAPGILSNDLSAEGYVLTASVDSPPADGLLNLSADGSLTYQPAANAYGLLSFTYIANDGVNDSDPAMVSLSILPVNDAPELDNSGDMHLEPVAASDFENSGTPINSLLASAGSRISDVDDEPLQGIAITAADSANGIWQYSTTGGLVWEALGAVTKNNARLLASDSNTRLRFVPQAGFTGLIEPAITFRAWDRTTGTNGDTADSSSNGGITAFSAAQETASLEVYPTADLALTKAASASAVLAGNLLVYTMNVVNHGPSSAAGVEITDRLPAALTFVSASTGCSEASGLVTCVQDGLAPGETASFELTVRVNEDTSGAIVNTAQAAAATHDASSVNNSSSATVMVMGQMTVLDPEETPDPDVWSKSIVTQPPCGSSFMGEFGNETITLSLENLPEHSRVIISFDLLILRSWDGNQTTYNTTQAQLERVSAMGSASVGPDQWSMRVDGRPVVNTTFSNWDAYGFHQAYPGTYPGDDYPARTMAKAIDSTCYTFVGQPLDSVYHMEYSLPHSAASLLIDFGAIGLQSLEDESWGLDNVTIKVASDANQMPYIAYAPFVRR